MKPTDKQIIANRGNADKSTGPVTPSGKAIASRNALKHGLQVKKKLGSIPESHELDRLLKYEGSIEKQFYKAINQLERPQRIRKGDNVPAPVNIDLNIDKENGSR